MSAARGARGAGASEARAAMGELVAELDTTRKELARTTLQLTHLETTVQHLRTAEGKKDEMLRHMELEQRRREEAHQEEMAIAQEEHRAKDGQWAHRVKHLELEAQRQRQELDAALLFEKENRQLRDTVLGHQATVERLRSMNEELRARAREDTREHAAQMEAEFKRRLAESEATFRAEAYRALSEEAKVALQGNDHLQTVLQRQNDSIETVLGKCKTLEVAHAKVSQEQELSSQSLQHHMAEAQRLRKQLADAKSRSGQLEEQLKQRKVERASLELLFIEYEATRKQLAKERDRARRALSEAERWQGRAVALTQELTGEQQTAAEAKLQAVVRHNERLDANAQRQRQRKAKRETARLKNTEAAALLRGPEAEDDDAGSQLSDDAEPGTLPTGGAPGGQAVNPMEILAMWNVNFEHWRPEDAPGDAVPDPAEDPVAEGAPTTAPLAPPAAIAPPVATPPRPATGAASAGEDSGLLPPVSAKPAARAHSSGTARAAGPSVSSTVRDRNAALSVLSRPKPAVPPAVAKLRGPAVTTPSTASSPALPRGHLGVVAKGEFTMRSKTNAKGDRFITP